MNFPAILLCLSTLMITFFKASELHTRTSCRQKLWLKRVVQQTNQTLSKPSQQLPFLGSCSLKAGLELSLEGKL